jgi:hypothetical protein
MESVSPLEPAGPLAVVLTTKDLELKLPSLLADNLPSPPTPALMLPPTHGEVVLEQPGTTPSLLTGVKPILLPLSPLETPAHLAVPPTLLEMPLELLVLEPPPTLTPWLLSLPVDPLRLETGNQKSLLPALVLSPADVEPATMSPCLEPPWLAPTTLVPTAWLRLPTHPGPLIKSTPVWLPPLSTQLSALQTGTVVFLLQDKTSPTTPSEMVVSMLVLLLCLKFLHLKLSTIVSLQVIGKPYNSFSPLLFSKHL